MLFLGACCVGSITVRTVDEDTQAPVKVDKIDITNAKGNLISSKRNESWVVQDKLKCGQYYIAVNDNTNVIPCRVQRSDLHPDVNIPVKASKVKFVVTDAANKNEISGPVLIELTNKRTQASFSLRGGPAERQQAISPGDYRIKISAEGYVPIDITRYLTKNEPCYVELIPVSPVLVQFTVLDSDTNKSIENPSTTISIFSSGSPVQEIKYPGKKQITLNKALYSYTISNEAYITATGDLDLRYESSKRPVSVKLEAITYSVTLSFIDNDTGEQIDSASVVFDGYSYNWGNRNHIKVKPGSHSFVARASGYAEYESGVFEVYRDIDEIVYFTPSPVYEITVKATDKSTGKRIPDPMITVDGNKVNNPCYLSPGTYQFKVSKSGYTAQTKDIRVMQDSTEEFKLPPVKTSVEITFKVTDSSGNNITKDAKLNFSNPQEFDRGSKHKVTATLGNDTKSVTFSADKNKTVTIKFTPGPIYVPSASKQRTHTPQDGSVYILINQNSSYDLSITFHLSNGKTEKAIYHLGKASHGQPKGPTQVSVKTLLGKCKAGAARVTKLVVTQVGQ